MPLPEAEISRFYSEGGQTARLYGATATPRSDAEMRMLFCAMRPKLEPSPVIFEFLDIMRRAPVFPATGRPFQRLMVRAAIEVLPVWARSLLELNAEPELRSWQRRIICGAGRLADRLPLAGSPPVEACRRLGLPETYLFTRP
jgi:uncharacterized protein (DUF2236 family)